MYATREQALEHSPKIRIPQKQNSLFDQYHPAKCELFMESDREMIRILVDGLMRFSVFGAKTTEYRGDIMDGMYMRETLSTVHTMAEGSTPMPVPETFTRESSKQGSGVEKVNGMDEGFSLKILVSNSMENLQRILFIVTESLSKSRTTDV
eukprot:gene7625-9080_t